MAGAKDLICLQKRVKSVDIEAQRSSVCQEKDWREKSRDWDGDCCPGLRAMDMMSAPCCDGANGLSVSFASSVFSHCPYWRRRGQPIFHLNMRWASAQEPGILSLSLYPILLKSGRSTSAAHGLMKSALQDSHHRESWTYRRDARPAQYPGVSSTGSHGRNPWTWSLSRALLSRCLLTVIVFPRGNGADSRSKF